MSRALVFPGQGSQTVGMGQELAAAYSEVRHSFEEVDDALSFRLTRLMFEGPEQELRLTENAQPALLAMGVALMRLLRQQAGVDPVTQVRFVAGHSLGEYTALAAVEAMGLADAARLVRARGQAMQRAVPVGIGAMAALIGVDLPEAADIAEAARPAPGGDSEVCVPANDNAPGQVVVSGHADAVNRALVIAAERGKKRCMLLPVSAPFHSPLMAPAADVMAAELATLEMTAPLTPVISNVTAAPVVDPAAIRDLLIKQVTGLVRWRESVEFMAREGVEAAVELGPGKVLAGLVRRIDKSIATSSVGGPQEFETLARSFA